MHGFGELWGRGGGCQGGGHNGDYLLRKMQTGKALRNGW